VELVAPHAAGQKKYYLYSSTVLVARSLGVREVAADRASAVDNEWLS